MSWIKRSFVSMSELMRHISQKVNIDQYFSYIIRSKTYHVNRNRVPTYFIKLLGRAISNLTRTKLYLFPKNKTLNCHIFV